MRAAAAATATFLVLVFIAARAIDAGTGTIAASNRDWLVACALAGFAAGFVGSWLARRAHYAAAIAGPAALALLFALTTTARDPEGPWAALAVTVAAAALGAASGERLVAAQRRR